MKNTLIISLISILIFVLPVLGGDAVEMGNSQPPADQDNDFAVNKWHAGPYLLAGIGPSETVSVTNSTPSWSYGGCHILLNCGYWAFDAFGIELGGFIDYGYFRDLRISDYTGILPLLNINNKTTSIEAHMWDSSFYLSVMIRCPLVERTDLFNLYFKLMIGYGVSVCWVEDIPTSSLLRILSTGYGATLFLLTNLPNSPWTRHSDRFHSDSPVFGLSIGNIFNAFNEKTVWYLQLTFLAKMYREVIGVKGGALVPEKVASFDYINNNHVIQLHVTAGIRLF